MSARHEPDREAMLEALRHFMPGDTVHEVRIPKVKAGGFKRVDAGYFDDPEAAADAMTRYTGELAAGVYITANPCRPELLSRARNRIAERAETTTSDGDILAYRRLLIDIDPKRPAGISATDEERVAAVGCASAVFAFLRDQGWPAAQMTQKSGNGAYLVYGLDLTNDADTRQLIGRALKALAGLFDSDQATIDTGVGNPSRIMGIPGTWNAKGDNDHEGGRPWRLRAGRYFDAPAVTRAQLEALAASHGPEEPARIGVIVSPGASKRSWEIGDVLTSSGFGWKGKTKDYGTLYELDRCLTSDAHTDGAAIIEALGGKLFYRCLHNSCQGKTWHDAKQALRLPERPQSAHTAETASHMLSTAEPAQRAAAARVAVVRPLSDFEPRAVDWLWRGWMPRGMLTLLGGAAGDGKSTVIASIVAALTTGGKLPDGTQAPTVSVLMLAAEDDPHVTIRPRLDHHRADINRVHLLQGTATPDGKRGWFDLRRDFELLGEQVALHDIGAVVIDPLSAYMSGSDRNSEGDVRDTLEQFLQLAQDRHFAVLGVVHTGKTKHTRPEQAFLGSTAFVARARSAWMLLDLPKAYQPEPTGPDDCSPQKKVLGVVKSNISMFPPALGFSIPLDGAIRWHGASPVSIQEAWEGDNADAPTRQEQAAEWLRDYLAGGPRWQRDIEAAAKDAKIAPRTLQRARTELTITVRKAGGQNGGWAWSLGPITDEALAMLHKQNTPKSANVATLATFPSNREVSGDATDGSSQSDGRSDVADTGRLPNLPIGATLAIFGSEARAPNTDRDENNHQTDDIRIGELPTAAKRCKGCDGALDSPGTSSFCGACRFGRAS